MRDTKIAHVISAAAFLWFLGVWSVPLAHAAVPSFQSGATATGTGDTVTVNKPSGTVAGDVMVAAVNFEKGSNVTATPPSGWTLIRRDNAVDKVGMATFYKVAGASEPASYSWTLDIAPKWAAGIARISGADTAAPINVSGGNTGKGGDPVAPSVSTTIADTLVLAFYTSRNAPTYTPASGTTEQWDAPNTSGGEPSNMLATFGVASPGASGSKAATPSISISEWAAQQVVVVGSDTTAPAAVTDLALSGATTSSMDLTWTAPGDDGNTGTASLYDIRYSTSPIVTEADFTAAALVSGEPSPSVAGTVQSMTVTGLSANTTHYFAMKTRDEVPNVSPVSNVPSLSTAAAPDTDPPAAVTTLALSEATTSSMDLTWTAPGDDGNTGTASLYDIRYSTSQIVTAADFSAASLVSGEPAPSVAGTEQSMTVIGLSANTTYYFAMKTQDEVPNVSFVSNVPSLSTAAAPDTDPPAAVTTLTLSRATTSSMDLTWTAPGDDGNTGTASLYDIRYATAPIVTAADFSAAPLVSGEPAPSVAGTEQSMTVTGLSANTTYYFAMKTQDEVPNVSPMSNVPSLSTAAADTSPPSAVTDLSLSGAGTNSIQLTWTAPGDDGNTGTASLYDIRYSTSPIVTAADFSAASLVSGEPAPSVAGTPQSMTVGGLASGMTYFFAMKTQDEVPNVSFVSNVPSLSTAVSGGATAPDTTPPVISAVSAASITQSSVIITWETNEDADSLVRFGPTYSLGGTVTNGFLVRKHSVSILGLTPGTTYHFTPCSKDFASNQACLGEYVFKTLPASAPAPAYGAAEALASSPTISIDRSLATSSGAATTCVSGTLMKQPSDGDPATQADSAVYYCGSDGKRYAFPDAGTYHSWYPDFSGVNVISVAELAAVPFGGNVTYRPGARMIKVQTDPRVYAVAKGGTLRWVTNEAVAQALYGVFWNRWISDVSDAFFAHYVIGASITLDDVAPATTIMIPPAVTDPSACTTSGTFTEFMNFGSTDAQVLPLQELLQCLGFFPATVVANGHFGPATEEAVKQFQAAHGIAPVGYVGPGTREALNRYGVR